jgi:hypothetical protein
VITPASPEQERDGIDGLFENRFTGEIATVEYKTDDTARRTGNAFIETISVDTSNRAGWTSAFKAQWLFYYLPGTATLYIAPSGSTR